MADLLKCRTCDKQVSSEAPACPHCGQPEPDSASWKLEVRRLIGAGQKIQAVKLVERETGWKLGEAKRFVEDRM